MIELVMAQDEDGLIGVGNKLPWYLKEELTLESFTYKKYIRMVEND